MIERCSCGHLMTTHALVGIRHGRAVRAGCSRSGCNCARYEPGPLGPRYCVTCGARWAPEEAARAAEPTEETTIVQTSRFANRESPATPAFWRRLRSVRTNDGRIYHPADVMLEFAEPTGDTDR